MFSSPLASKEKDSLNIHAKWDDECECARWGEALESQLVLLKKKKEGRERVGEGGNENLEKSESWCPSCYRVYSRGIVEHQEPLLAKKKHCRKN